VPEVYEWLKGCGGYVITEFDINLDDAEKLSDDAKQFLDDFWERYNGYSAWGLVSKTHENGSPWSKIYNKGLGDRQIIPVDLLKQAQTL
jgi:uncharacterized phage-associated protein